MINRTKQKKHEILMKIYALGEKQGLTPRQLVVKAGFNKTQYEQFFCPNIKTLEKLAAVVDAKIDLVTSSIQ